MSIGGVGTLAGCSILSDDAESTDTPTADGNGTPTPVTTEATGPGGGSGPVVISLEAGGSDIWNRSDFGHYYYAEVSGDFDARVQVTSIENTNPHAKGGLMLRESLDPGSRNVMVRRRSGYGTSTQWRPADGEPTMSTTSDAGSKISEIDGGFLEGMPWQRLERSGDTIRAYASEDGKNWTLMVELPASRVSFSDTVYLGLAATSHDQANATTVKFRNLAGVEPTDNGDLGNPIVSGGVSVSQAAVVSGLEAVETAPSAATLRGELESLGAGDAVEVTFEYREVTQSEWQTSGGQTTSETGEVWTDVSGLDPRRYYEFRAVADDGQNAFTTVPALFSTPSTSDGSESEGPRSASAFDPNDGFAEMAPWLDDDTPIVVVDEPTREALETATGIPGPRVVVFATSGTIDLGARDLNVRNGKCWIAGQTAPSPGITLTRGGLWLYGDDCVVQHLRVRPGNAGQDEGWQPDSIEVADDTQNNVVDHCTGTWSVDENINAGYDTKNTTVSNCLVAEPLDESTHPKEAHGYNSIVGDRATNVALMGNVWALGTDRNPRLKQGSEAVVVNNFVHHYHDGMWADPDTSHSIEGNAFEAPQTSQANVFGEGSVHAADNVQLDDADVAMVGDSITRLDSRPLWPDGLATIPSGEVKSHNLAHAGARPADRSAIDERIVETIRAGDGAVIDSQSEVGGYPSLAENSRTPEVPESGLRAWLRERALAVE